MRAVADKPDIKLDIGTEVEEIDPEIRRYLTRRGESSQPTSESQLLGADKLVGRSSPAIHLP